MDGMNMMSKSRSKIRGKANIISKTWERCKSIGRKGNMISASTRTTTATTTTRSKSWPSRRDRDEARRGSTTTEEGCFSVYVGPQMQRFVIKTEYANHPLFKMLLEEAESEYGYSSQGPLALPCNVDIFYKVLMEMEHDQQTQPQPHGCVFRKRSRSAYHLLSPSPILAINNF